jgi:hypothetical protein
LSFPSHFLPKSCMQFSFLRATCHAQLITYLLMYGDESFLRSCQLCSHSGNSQQL